jgi:hypothetical protein
MKISNHLPQFSTPRLLIAAGKQEAVFYVADAEDISHAASIKIPKSSYTDREGRSDKRVPGKMMQSGSTHESQDDEQTRALIKRLAETATQLVFERGINGIYLFCPTYLSNRMEEGMPREIQDMIEYIFYGNYHHQHPFVLLSKILEYQRQEKDHGIIEPIKNEALSILKKTAPFAGPTG